MKTRTDKKLSASTLRRILSRLKPEIPRIAASFLCALASVFLTLLLPILIGNAVDLIVGAGQVQFSALYPILLRTAVCALGCALAGWFCGLLNNRIVFSIVYRQRQEIFQHLQALPLSYLDRKPTGEIVSRVIADVDQYAEGLLLGFSQLFTGVLTIIGTLLFMLFTDISITAVVVLLTPLSLLVARFIARRTYRLFRTQSEVKGEETAFIEEMIGNAKVVKAFSQAENALSSFDKINGKLNKASLQAIFYSSLVNPSTRFVNSLVYAGVALTGALSVLSGGGMSVGNLFCFLSYANQYTKPFNEISGVMTEMQNAIACAARVFELLDEPVEKEFATTVPDTGMPRGEVYLRDVCFSYTPGKPLLQHLNLRILPGQRVAIVGPTGCGKTTLINLLMRFYDVDSGSVSIDGRDVRTLPRQKLRRAYGMVLQDTWLRSGTVRENIAMGNPEANDDTVEAAARAAHADSFIRRLPKGYDTLLGEDGGSLSQGQKQLLCIARIMLTKPPMLILDEATSSIDTRTEWKVQDAFRKLMRGRTSFIVAHRLSTIEDADLILVMRNGAVVEMGTHPALLAQNGFYAALYNSQFEPM